jgi:hypothetical protein
VGPGAIHQRLVQQAEDRARRNPGVPELKRLATDRQNIHTRAVSEQTNRTQEFLLKQGVALPNQTLRVPEWFLSIWAVSAYGKGWQMTRSVVDDMDRWYNTPSCRTPNDYLYRRVLNGLYVYARNTPHGERRDEIKKRVFEECYESIGMCCEGHISRLCNVLVGFDENAQPELPLGERIQNEMARISATEKTEAEKVKDANAFFDEHKVPAENRTAWLEAF